MAKVSTIKIICDVIDCGKSSSHDSEFTFQMELKSMKRSTRETDTVPYDLCEKHAAQITKVLNGNVI